MIEDVLNQILPVVGFSSLVSSIFIALVLFKGKTTFRFLLFLAILDILQGASTIYAGLYGVFISIYGEKGEKTIRPFKCFLTAFHNIIWAFTDVSSILLLLLFSIDRVLQMIIPVQYKKVSDIYLSWRGFIVYLFISATASIPAFQFAMTTSSNSSMVINTACRHNEVVGEEYYNQHILSYQIFPFIALIILIISLLLKGIRETSPKWSYNWSEDRVDSKQLFTACFLRSVLTCCSIYLPATVLPERFVSPSGGLIDYSLRTFYCIFVPTLQPLIYTFFVPVFNTRVQLVFNRYSHSTKREWLSASDPPPAPGEVKDKYGEVNPFGSWYSSTGNVVGEAGLPMEMKSNIERK
ncbi:unnamed protein product [Auanema sp. JU1783]|nr:unnamed protein product [Auanema sp. JU1783]